MIGSTLISVLMLGHKLAMVLATTPMLEFCVCIHELALHVEGAQVNQIKQVLARRAEAEDLLKLLITHPSGMEKTVEVMRLQSKRRYSILGVVEGIASVVTATTVSTAYQATSATATTTKEKARSIENSSQC